MHTCCTWLSLYATPTHLPSICPGRGGGCSMHPHKSIPNWRFYMVTNAWKNDLLCSKVDKMPPSAIFMQIKTPLSKLSICHIFTNFTDNWRIVASRPIFRGCMYSLHWNMQISSCILNIVQSFCNFSKLLTNFRFFGVTYIQKHPVFYI